MDIEHTAFDGIDAAEHGPLVHGSVSLVATNGRIRVAHVAPPKPAPWDRAFDRPVLRRALAAVLRLPDAPTARQELWFDADTVARMRRPPGPADGAARLSARARGPQA
ncbi:hypothetical protein [Salipiger bermudensis]|uniref:hypothetical protein n=1 Tax=Salipiger bermudensis TaxID=344736 RepID=UPI001CD5F7CB|nr:hypothetical protein [Salipiger bermudensis]MCA0962462.1 hypothetical protein [Salipiger bermudensis]